MTTSKAQAQWNGIIKSGKGEMMLGANTFPFSFNSRMEGGAGSTPEQLLAGALAGCYSMALSGGLERAGFPPEQISTSAKTNFDNVNGQWTVVSIDLDVQVRAPGIDDAKFQENRERHEIGLPGIARAGGGDDQRKRKARVTR